MVVRVGCEGEGGRWWLGVIIVRVKKNAETKTDRLVGRSFGGLKKSTPTPDVHQTLYPVP